MSYEINTLSKTSGRLLKSNHGQNSFILTDSYVFHGLKFIMRIHFHCFPTLICSILLVLLCLFFFRWRYADDDGDPLGSIYITEIREKFNRSKFTDFIQTKGEHYFAKHNVSAPILVWWTPFTFETGAYIRCGQEKNHCFVSNIRKYRDNPDFSAFLFYGTDLHLFDLPFPRHKHEQWSLLHEESPKNNFAFSFPSIMTMFNHTATFKRQSNLPLTTQWLQSIDDLLDQTYFVDAQEKNRLQREENLAPIIYIQSDCNTPSDRDLYIKTLMKYIPIDSYGMCLHNKDLPEKLRNPVETMEHDEILRLVGKYKFALAFENAVCTDYITEKFWRPLKVGTVPIVYGSDRFQDFLPDPHSAISMLDFTSPSDLAQWLHQLNTNDTLYDSYRQFKLTRSISKENLLYRTMSERTWGIHNDRIRGNFISKFECLVCERIHQTRKDPTVEYRASFDHYGCPPPITFDENGQLRERSGHWYRTYEFVRNQVEVFDEWIQQGNYSFTEADLFQAASKRFSPSFRRDEFL